MTDDRLLTAIVTVLPMLEKQGELKEREGERERESVQLLQEE